MRACACVNERESGKIAKIAKDYRITQLQQDAQRKEPEAAWRPDARPLFHFISFDLCLFYRVGSDGNGSEWILGAFGADA